MNNNNIAKKFVDQVSIAMHRENIMHDVIMLFLAKIKEYNIKLTDDEKLTMRKLFKMG